MFRRKWPLLLLVLIVFIASIIAAIFFISARVNAPHQGVVQASNVKQPVTEFDLTAKHVSGTFASFDYPSGMDRAPNNQIVAPVVEQFNYLHRDIESWHLAIAIMKNPGGNITNNNSYQYRKSKPEIYKETDIRINSLPVTVMQDTSVSGFSKVAIMQHGEYGATISLYGDDPAGQQQLENTLDIVLNSWHWQ